DKHHRDYRHNHKPRVFHGVFQKSGVDGSDRSAFRWAWTIWRAELLENNTFQPKLAGGGEHFVATAVR
ncbi:MAG: hypothetical protein WB036_22455, partial [Pseudolabrys sp.]